MTFSLAQILTFIVIYLSLLFTVAHSADRGWIPRVIVENPIIYVLSLGVVAGGFAISGTLELAARHGYSFLLYYSGLVMMFILGTLILLPLLRICRIYQLSSLADVLTFRFRSNGVGASITIAMCITMLPLLALQIQAVADSIHILAGDSDYLLTGLARQDRLAFVFCFIITVFTLLFGSRQRQGQGRNEGLVVAIAFESVVKLIAFSIVMIVAVQGSFGGFAELDMWLSRNAQVAKLLDQPLSGELARGLLLIFFAGAVAMPHIFHMAFAENTESRHLRTATWGLPLYLMLLSLPVLPVVLAGIKLEQPLPLDYTALGVGQALQSPTISSAAFVAGLSAASATIIVSTLALANMCMNHLLLPWRIPKPESDRSLYSQLTWLRRGVICAIILCGYLFFRIIGGKESLTQLGLVAFVGTLQFLPGIVATLYWPGANRKGLIAGMVAGLGVWTVTLLLPLVGMPSLLLADTGNLLGSSDSVWLRATLLSTILNGGLFALVSLATTRTREEIVAAEICSMDDLSRPFRHTISLRGSAEFIEALVPVLGETTARNEVNRALQELQFDQNESRPYALRRLRGRIEANLSGLLGPAVAHSILQTCIPLQGGTTEGIDDINLIERNLEKAQVHFTGLAADLDNLRRHYRQTLNNLPVGVCSLGSDGEILMWNRAMEQLTWIDGSDVLGSLLNSLPRPWSDTLGGFTDTDQKDFQKREVVDANGTSRWITLHKASTASVTQIGEDLVILAEDVTDSQQMEQELLHTERLASIGRLAAGVAHEVGNPITGIACLAQNLEYESDLAEIRQTGVDIHKQTERVTRIVESLVNFSHVGSAAGNIQLTACNLADCIDEAVSLLSLDTNARTVSFRNACDRETLVLADSQRLLQVFLNLLGNARDASAVGAPVTVLEIETHGEGVCIAVDDEGSGIPIDVQGRVFEPFFTSKEPGQGTGLGLALVYSIMEDLGGSVSLVSPVDEDSGCGTRFQVTLRSASYDTTVTGDPKDVGYAVEDNPT